jgi:hypothetical protein
MENKQDHDAPYKHTRLAERTKNANIFNIPTDSDSNLNTEIEQENRQPKRTRSQTTSTTVRRKRKRRKMFFTELQKKRELYTCTDDEAIQDSHQRGLQRMSTNNTRIHDRHRQWNSPQVDSDLYRPTLQIIKPMHAKI